MTDPRPRAWNSTLPVRSSGLPRTPFPQPSGPSLRSRAWLRSAPKAGEVVALQPRRQRPATLAAAFSPQVRQAIRDRAVNACEACAVYLGPGAGQIQHRVARGMGGSRNPVLGSAVNGVLLCGTPASGCHGRAEAREREFHAQGFWLWQYEDPAGVPIMLHGGVMVWLAADGGYSTVPPQGVA